MLHLGAPPCTSPSDLNENLTSLSLCFFGPSLLYTHPSSPGSTLKVALQFLILVSAVPQLTSTLPVGSFPADATTGRTRPVTTKAVKIHFFIPTPFGLGDAELIP